ncbi:MAG: HAMP domain-containing histidine kinase [Deltaproteobacteria bacterium]|nr:HAMP domain-containing histidine kinase [Deltaproteobacteria bacterium]MCB9789148.1 HAMP domain-containing histidine kinase [Deltaproteobacteria bacterium]
MTLTVVFIATLALASTGLLYLQARQATVTALAARGQDKAQAFVAASRTTQGDDGVLARIAADLVKGPVVAAGLFDAEGHAVSELPWPASGDDGHDPSRWAPRALSRGAPVTGGGGGLPGVGEVTLWVPFSVERGAASGPTGPGLPGATPTPGGRLSVRRVLALALVPGDEDRFVTRTLAHAVLITALLVLLVGLTRRQVRLIAEQQARERERSAERRFTTLGRMSAVLAHEIRNPLGAIKGFAQYTARRFPEGDAARGDMDTIVEESSRLEALVASLLLYARPTRPELRETALQTVAERAVRLAGHLAEDAGVATAVVAPGGPVQAPVDAEQLTQALLNLVTNAIEAISGQERGQETGGGHVTVSVTADGGAAVIEVSDDGPGIPLELQGELFEPYVTHNKTHGTGLGLAVAARVAEAHGGSLTVDSRPGEGARFVLRLPLSAGGDIDGRSGAARGASRRRATTGATTEGGR